MPAKKTKAEPKRGRGRPKGAFKPVDLDKLEEAAAVCPRVGRCAAVVGLNRDTLSYRLRNDPEVRAAFDRGANKGMATLERAAFDLALSGDAATLRFLLRNRDPQAYCAAERNVKMVETTANVNVSQGEAAAWLASITGGETSE